MMMTKTLRPGLLVSLKTSLVGNVVYRTLDIDADHVTEEGTRRAKWETERTIQDPAEYERGIKARSKARSLVTAICAPSSFGLLCPESQAEALKDAIEAARDVAELFNVSATMTRVQVFAIVGRVAADDAEAVRAINSELRDLLDQMENGVRKLDASAIRDAANKARALGAMLSDNASERVKNAIETARKTAREIVKAGEAATIEVDQATIAAIENARTAFLDIGDETEIGNVDAAPERAVEFEPASPALAELYGKGPVRETAPAARLVDME